MALLCLALQRRDPDESAPLATGLRIALASAAVPVALIGMTGWALYDSHAYASRYGYTVSMELPKGCTTGGDRITCKAKWLTPDRREMHGTLHITSRARAGDESPADVEVTVLAVDNEAYFPATRVHAGPLTPLGRPPVPWLTAAVFVAVLVPVWIGARTTGRRRLAAFEPPDPPSRKATPQGPSATDRRVTTRRPAAPITVTSRFARVTADRSGLVIEENRGLGTGEHWITRLRLAWLDLERVVFTYSPRDPTVTLYLHTTAGRRHYGLDAKHLSHAQWHDLAATIAAMTRGRLTLNVSEL